MSENKKPKIVQGPVSSGNKENTRRKTLIVIAILAIYTFVGTTVEFGFAEGLDTIVWFVLGIFPLLAYLKFISNTKINIGLRVILGVIILGVAFWVMVMLAIAG